MEGEGSKPGASERVAENVWLVRASLGPGATVCLYILRGEKLAIVDTGFNNHPGETIAPALAAIGLRLDQVDLILNTHGHADHTGGNAALKDASGAAIHLHRADRAMAAGPEGHLTVAGDIVETLRTLGRHDEIPPRESMLRQRVGRDVGVDRILDDGDEVDLGHGFRLRVVHTPGHTPGSVTFFSERDGLALAGDAIQAWGGRPGALPFYFDPASYTMALQRLLDLPVATLCLGHPMHWSGAASGPAPIVTGPEIGRILRDSLEFIGIAKQAASEAVAEGDAPLEALVDRGLAKLPEPFRVSRQPDGRFPAFFAATMLGHVRSMQA